MVLRSMTGFGQGSASAAGVTVTVEVKTVNHKGLDLKLRLPRHLHSHEPALVHQVKARLDRGRVDIAVDVAATDAAAAVVDDARVAAVVATVRALHARHPEVEASLGFADLLKIPGVMVSEDHVADVEELHKATTQALTTALDELDRARQVEGAGLGKDIEARRRSCSSLVQQVAQRTAATSSEKKARLTEKLVALIGPAVEPQRLAAEAAVLAEKLDVSEELSRLDLHLTALAALLEKPGSGRKLDFLCQELMREANTTASKCQDAAIAHLVVELKAEIERIREQAQNIE